MAIGKYRFIAVFGILIAVLVIGFAAWTMAGNLDLGRILQPYNGPGTKVGLVDCQTVQLSGIWDIVISQGPPSLTIFAEQATVDKLKIDQSSDTLSIEQPGWGIGLGLRAEIKLPRPEKLLVNGGSKITVAGFESSKFGLSLEGACSVEIRACAIQNLWLKADGASRVVMIDSSAVNAEIQLRGASSAELNLKGGELSGYVEGVVHVGYSGSIKKNTVRVDGLAKVEPKT